VTTTGFWAVVTPTGWWSHDPPVGTLVWVTGPTPSGCWRISWDGCDSYIMAPKQLRSATPEEVATLALANEVHL
jgi:hypothetical protein